MKKMEAVMSDDNKTPSQDATSSSNEQAQDLKRETVQQLTGLAKPKSYGTTQMVNARDYTLESDTENLHG